MANADSIQQDSMAFQTINGYFRISTFGKENKTILLSVDELKEPKSATVWMDLEDLEKLGRIFIQMAKSHNYEGVP